ncbi:hypothetical protein EIP91_007129 [Steccherinum ochraceum]|uniref:SGNH hydrolase-type esterase domain-containing protein n=1 Tax=Steccherinum ochraceum TaxID=92696 RepID=A0A4R0R4P1_9APHY|nr:hypothetical protein EIP91_007129 [Steccherinum ochraceum]
MAANVQDTIMLFGDSLTEMGSEAGGIVQRLSAVYKRKLDVLNRGFSGYNTRWAIPVLEQILAKKSEQANLPAVRLLTIWFGANDAAVPETHRQHIPLAYYTDNLTKLIRLVKDPSSAHYSPDTKIVVITPPPVNTEQWAEKKATMDPPDNQLDRSFEATKAYARAAKEVAAREGVEVVDAWTVLWKAAGEVEGQLSQFMSDGLHLNENGYEILYNELISVISTKLPELHYEKLNDVFVSYRDIDYANPDPSLQKRKA